MLKRFLIAIAIAALVVAVAFYLRNPEKSPMDAAARAGVPGQFVTLADGVTHYDIAGPDTGQRVILIHGFSTPYYIWDSTSIALAAAGFRVARYDLFGRGYSDRPAVDYDLDLFDRQLLQLLDSLGWKEPVDVVGLSMGGMVVGGFTGRHPGRVRSMTMVDPAAGPADQLPLQFRLPVVGPFLWQLLVVPGMANGQNADFLEPGRWPDWSDRYRVQMGFQGFGQALRSTQIHRVDLDTLYARVGVVGTRSLLIWGKEDKVVPFEESNRVRKAIPQIRFEPIDRAAHLPHMERTDLVNPLLIRFLRSDSTGSTPNGTTGLALPVPTGPAIVGTTRMVVQNGDRPLPVTAWYPAADSTGVARAPYLPDAEALAPLATRPGPMAAELANRSVATHGWLDPPVRSGALLPVVVFSHGYLALPSNYTALMEDLASHGFAVFSIAHTGESMVATLPGGRVVSILGPDGKLSAITHGVIAEWKTEDSAAAAVTGAVDSPGAEAALRRYLARIPKSNEALARWVDDSRRVMDEIARLAAPGSGSRFAARLDLGRVGAVGHSMGGLTSAAWCAVDGRCGAAINLDGSPQYGDLIDRPSPKPLLMVYAGGRPARVGVSDLVYARGKGYTRAVVAGAGHGDFGDWVYGPPSGSDRVARPTFGAITRKLVREFLEASLSRPPRPLTGNLGFPGLELLQMTS